MCIARVNFLGWCTYLTPTKNFFNPLTTSERKSFLHFVSLHFIYFIAIPLHQISRTNHQLSVSNHRLLIKTFCESGSHLTKKNQRARHNVLSKTQRGDNFVLSKNQLTCSCIPFFLASAKRFSRYFSRRSR